MVVVVRERLGSCGGRTTVPTLALEVVIALCATYLFLSIVVLALVELVSGLASLRARSLEKGMIALLTGDKLRTQVFEHPLILTLTRASGGKPSYIPGKFFARAVLDEVARLQAAGGKVDDAYREFLQTLDEDSRKTLEGVVGTTVDSLEVARERVEQWFDAGMDRVSGAFKRHMQWITRAIALTLVLAVNANTMEMGRILWSDPQARAAAVAFAAQELETCKQAQAEPQPTTGRQEAPSVDCSEVIEQTQARVPLPLGWTRDKLAAPFEGVEAFLQALVGFLLTILAVSLGAPFWFDMLRKVAPGIQQSGPKPR
jgi:hypothetical protein